MPTWREDKRNILEIIDFDRLNQLCIKNNKPYSKYHYHLEYGLFISLNMYICNYNMPSADLYPK